MIKFWPEKNMFEFSTPAEAAAVVKLLTAGGKKTIQKGSPLQNAIAAFIGTPSPWTGSLFWEFVSRLGEPQKRVLGELVRKGALRDEDLRQLLGLEDNKQLSGVLSGISKQAGSHEIPARAVYKIENESKSGQFTKTYAAAPDFLRIASEMNWPDE